MTSFSCENSNTVAFAATTKAKCYKSLGQYINGKYHGKVEESSSSLPRNLLRESSSLVL